MEFYYHEVYRDVLILRADGEIDSYKVQSFLNQLQRMLGGRSTQARRGLLERRLHVERRHHGLHPGVQADGGARRPASSWRRCRRRSCVCSRSPSSIRFSRRIRRSTTRCGRSDETGCCVPAARGRSGRHSVVAASHSLRGSLPPEDAFASMADAERAFAAGGEERGVRAAFLEYPRRRRDRVSAVARTRQGGVAGTSRCRRTRWRRRCRGMPRAGDVAASGDLGWLTGPYVLRTQRRRVAHGVRLLLLHLDSARRRALARAHRRWCLDVRAVRFAGEGVARLASTGERPAPAAAAGKSSLLDQDRLLDTRAASVGLADAFGSPLHRLRASIAKGKQPLVGSRQSPSSWKSRLGAGRSSRAAATSPRRETSDTPTASTIRRRTSGRQRPATTCGCGGEPPGAWRLTFDTLVPEAKPRLWLWLAWALRSSGFGRWALGVGLWLGPLAPCALCRSRGPSIIRVSRARR